MAEKGKAYQYKQGVGIESEIAFTVLSSGSVKIARKMVGEPSFLASLTFGLLGQNRNAVFTAFEPSKAKWVSSTHSYIAVFDFDTDVQLDISDIFGKMGQADPEAYAITKKLQSEGFWKARERTREIRQKNWWKDNGSYFLMALAFISLIVTGYFITHVQAQVVVSGTVSGSGSGTGSATGAGSIGGSILNSTIGAGAGAYNAISGVSNSLKVP